MSTLTASPRYEALSHQMQLRSTLEDTIKQLAEGHHFAHFPNDLFARLESMQKNVQGLRGAFVNTKFLIHQRHLMLDLATLTDDVQKGRISELELLDCLHLCKYDTLCIDSAFRATLPPIFWNVRSDSESTIAKEVFAIPEILEMILVQCKIQDVISCSLTCKGVHEIVEASTKLQVLRFLKAAPGDQSRRLPFGPGEAQTLECGPMPWLEADPSPIATISVIMDSKAVHWPRIGSRMQDMFISQPPIHRLLVWDNCKKGDNIWGGGPGFQMTSEDGFKVGDLYRMAEKFAKSHEGCRKQGGWDVGPDEEPRPYSYQVWFQEPLDEKEWDDAAAYTDHKSKFWETEYGAFKDDRWAGGFFDDLLLEGGRKKDETNCGTGDRSVLTSNREDADSG